MDSRPPPHILVRIVALTSLSLAVALMVWLVTWTAGANLIHAVLSGMGAAGATLVVVHNLID